MRVAIPLILVPVDLDPRSAGGSDGARSVLLPDTRVYRACVVCPVAVHPTGARVQRADCLPVSALHRVPQRGGGRQTRTGRVSAAAAAGKAGSPVRYQFAI